MSQRTSYIEQCCEIMHDAYENAAAENGWETQQASRVPWEQVPEENKNTMRAAVAALLDHIIGKEIVTYVRRREQT